MTWKNVPNKPINTTIPKGNNKENYKIETKRYIFFFSLEFTLEKLFTLFLHKIIIISKYKNTIIKSFLDSIIEYVIFNKTSTVSIKIVLQTKTIEDIFILTVYYNIEKSNHNG